MVQGAQAGSAAIDQVSKSAENAGKAVENASRQIDNASRVIATSTADASAKTQRFQAGVSALGEATQINNRVRLLGEAVRDLGSGFSNASTVTSVFAQGLVDVAQVSARAGGSFRGLITILAANPLLAAAGVLSAIATAMALFGSSTANTNEKLKEQIELQKKLAEQTREYTSVVERNISLRQAGFEIDEKQARLTRATQLVDLSLIVRQRREVPGQALQGYPVAELAQLAGVSQEDISSRRPNYVQGPQFIPQVTPQSAERILLDIARDMRSSAESLGRLELAPGFTGILNERQIQSLVERRRGRAGGLVGPTAPDYLQPYSGTALPTVSERVGYEQPIGPSVGPDFLTPEQREAYQKRFAPIGYEMEARRQKETREELRKLGEDLERLKSLGQDVGTAIGNAFFSIVNGAANARQALAALAQQFVLIAQQRAVQGVANALGNAFSASTQQQINNVQSNSTGGFQSSSGGFSPL
jgi:hypothetical protein